MVESVIQTDQPGIYTFLDKIGTEKNNNAPLAFCSWKGTQRSVLCTRRGFQLSPCVRVHGGPFPPPPRMGAAWGQATKGCPLLIETQSRHRMPSNWLLCLFLLGTWNSRAFSPAFCTCAFFSEVLNNFSTLYILLKQFHSSLLPLSQCIKLKFLLLLSFL